MSWVTIIWSMIASACLTLAAIYGLIWYRNRTEWAHLLFSVTAAATTAFAFCELQLMRAQTPGELFTGLRWGQLALFFWLVSLTWFVRVSLGAGRLWLVWTITGLRAFYLLLTILTGMSVHYLTIRLQHAQFLGESVTVPGGVPNPVMLFGQSTVVLILVFVADAGITAWRRGDRRKALMIGGSAEFFLLSGLGTSAVVMWGYVQAPIAISPLYLVMIAVMGYELSHDVLRSSQLVKELKGSEAGLRESEARMSLAVDVAGFGIWIRELPGSGIWASEKWRTLFGFTLSEPLDFDTILQRLHPDDRERLQQAQRKAIAGDGEGRYQMEYRLTLPDGATRWIASESRVECDAAGEPVLMRGAARDVTGRKLAEQEAQRLQQEIAHAGRVTMMGQLAASLAHEINQPLGSILRNAEAGELFLQQALPDLDEIRAILADIRADDERAGAVIDRMRGLLKQQTLDRRRLDLSALVGDVAALVRVDAASRQVKVDVDVPGDLPQVLGDRVHLQQVLLNLILNGMDALDGTNQDDRRVSVAARRDGAGVVEVAVADGGPGISTETLARIFDPFFTTKPDGMGMGLAISRTIVEAHGGRIWAENTGGGGAVFRLTLPIAPS
jgi:two-component system, LuxR family, sensor kinase FixL